MCDLRGVQIHTVSHKEPPTYICCLQVAHFFIIYMFDLWDAIRGHPYVFELPLGSKFLIIFISDIWAALKVPQYIYSITPM